MKSKTLEVYSEVEEYLANRFYPEYFTKEEFVALAKRKMKDGIELYLFDDEDKCELSEEEYDEVMKEIEYWAEMRHDRKTKAA